MARCWCKLGFPRFCRISRDYPGFFFVKQPTSQHCSPGGTSGEQRALVGVYHNLGRQHLQRYLDEIVWRWNHRAPVREVVKQWTTRAGVAREKSGVRSHWLTRCASSYRTRSASKSAARRNTAYAGRYADAFRSVGYTEHALLQSQRRECIIVCGAPGLLPSCSNITINIVSIMAKKPYKGYHSDP
ncbi:transposase [Sulfitobacter sp. 1A13496]|uniref:transposase n=1 Tax=Sulfitobacter sp. 1A13496 TaxID=3368596 RepID=UPI003746C666